MKSILTIFCLMAVALFLISCGGEKTEANNDTSAHVAHTPAANNDGLVLNDGKKWQMDAHTRNSFTTMAGSFVKADVTNLETVELKQAGAGQR